jgi:hypothetical protein
VQYGSAARHLRGGGCPEVEREADSSDPHISEWRERSSKGVLVHTKNVYAYSGLIVGPDTKDVENGKDHVDEEL